MKMSKEQVASAAVKISIAVAEMIRIAERIPSGHLYARLMEAGMTLDLYEAIIDCLKRSEIIEEKNHELIWKGVA